MINELLEELNTMWNLSDDSRYKGENPGCVDLSDAIEKEFGQMSDDEIKSTLDNLPSEQMEQILLAMEDLVDDRPVFEPYVTAVNAM